jgi:hypothetical protein
MLGTIFVNPSDNFMKQAQVISDTPANSNMIHCIYLSSTNKKSLDSHTFQGLTVWFQSSLFSARQQKQRLYYIKTVHRKEPFILFLTFSYLLVVTYNFVRQMLGKS